MTGVPSDVAELASREYQYGFVTDLDTDVVPPGLSEDVISSDRSKEERARVAARMALALLPPLADSRRTEMAERPLRPDRLPGHQSTTRPRSPRPQLASLDEVDPELRAMFDKLGISLGEQERLSGVAVDAIVDSVSVATTFKKKLAEVGVIFCSFSEAVQEHPDLVRRYLGSVVPYRDNFFATLNSAVFTDGSFCYIPKGVHCPMELSTYFRINAADTGQFERTLIVAEEGAYVSYLEGCTAPMRDENQLHAAVVELVALEGAQIKYSTVQNWYPGDAEGRGGIYNFVTKRGRCAGGRQDLLDPGRDRLGHHLEVPGRHPPRRQLRRRVLLRRPHRQPSAGRHRHQDDPHRQEHPQHHRLQGDLRRSRAEHLPGAR